MAGESNKKIIKYKRPFRLNIGLFIFVILFIYMCFSVASYLSRNKVRFYEVQAGGMVDDTEHTGLILRNEEVQNAASSGYINYYIREGKRAAVGTRIYSLDETGNLTKYLEDNSLNKVTLSDSNLSDLKKQLSSFSMSYARNNFSHVYDSRASLDTALSEYANVNALGNLDQTMKQNGISYTQVTSPAAGIVSFSVDSYEGKTPEQLTADDLNKKNYKSSFIKAGELAESGKPVYKLITGEDWKVVFSLSDADKTRYANQKSLKVSFKGYDLTVTGDFSMTAGADGTTLGVLSMDKYMVKFATDRFVTLNIEAQNESGLKIPKSAVAEKTFFTIPAEYLAKGGNDVDEGFYKEVYENGKTSIQYIPTEIFYQADNLYYVDNSEKGNWKAGDYVVKPDSTDRYQIGATASLKGVYNINKGYAVFKQIDVIAENDEYETVKKGTKYGLNVYDHILLQGSEAKEGEPIYQ